MFHHVYRVRDTAAKRIRDIHLFLAIVWGPTMIPMTIWGPLSGLKNSVLWVICISYYANMASHLSGWAGESATMAAEEGQEQTTTEVIPTIEFTEDQVRLLAGQLRTFMGETGRTTSDENGEW